MPYWSIFKRQFGYDDLTAEELATTLPPLRDPKKAIDSYQDLIAQSPQSYEVLSALENSARLFEENPI